MEIAVEELSPTGLVRREFDQLLTRLISSPEESTGKVVLRIPTSLQIPEDLRSGRLFVITEPSQFLDCYYEVQEDKSFVAHDLC